MYNLHAMCITVLLLCMGLRYVEKGKRISGDLAVLRMQKENREKLTQNLFSASDFRPKAKMLCSL